MNTPTKHTPGPWRHETAYPTTGGAFFEIANNQGDTVLRIRGGMSPTKSDAALIAAAPELLEALDRIAELQGSADYDHVKQQMTRSIARAAIAKATKGTQ